MQNNNSAAETLKPTCEYFEDHFNRKFRGRTVRSVSVDRLKLLKMPSAQLMKSSKSTAKSQNMLPKLREIQKIAKTQRKKGIKLNKYLDGISDLDLYIANKQLNNLTTRQLITQLAIRERRGTEHLEAINTFYATAASGNVKFHEVNQPSHQEGMSKTDYVRKGKWVSDEELVEKFDKFIVHGQEEESVHEPPRPKTKLTREQMAQKITADKEQVTQIAKRMIAEQNRYTQEEELDLRQKVSKRSALEDFSRQQNKSIDWILTQCDFYNKKFKIKRGLSKLG